MRIKTYLKPKSIEEAYECLTTQQGSQIIGGGAWIKILPKEIETAIDCSNCNLESIRETDTSVEIGSYATLRSIEKTAGLSKICDGILIKSIVEVMGVPFRNIATIGGTVAGKFGFSDIITALLALDTELKFFKRGTVRLEDYLQEKEHFQDILLSIHIPKDSGKGYFYTMKKTANDFSIVNMAIVKNELGYRIAIGARPGVATLAKETMKYLMTVDVMNGEVVGKATELMLQEIKFGSNPRGSKEYRQEVAKALLGRGLKEVNH